MIRNGTEIKQLQLKHRVDGQPDKETRAPSPPGAMCLIPWKSAQQTLADEIADQSVLHWRHAFLDYNIVEVRYQNVSTLFFLAGLL